MFEIKKETLRRIFLSVCGCIVLYWFLHETERVGSILKLIKNVLSPFILGGVLAFILNVPMRAIENCLLKKVTKLKLKRLISVAATFASMLLVVVLVFMLLIPQVVATFNSLLPNLYEFISEAETFFREVISDNPQLNQWLIDNTNMENVKWADLLQKALGVAGNGLSVIVGGAVSAIGTIFSGVFDAVIALVFTVYCLFQKETLARQGRKLLYAFLKEKTADTIVRVLRLTNSTFSNFLTGQCIEVCILGAMFAISMAIFRMPYIPLISVVIAVTAFIPIVGAWTGCVLGGFLILVEDPMLAVWFVIMFLVIQQIENNMIYPRVVGTSVGLNGMWVLIAVALGGELMGVAGMFLMIPVVSVLYTLLQEVTHKKLDNSVVDPAKLQPQPPELKSKFKEKRENRKNKMKIKKLPDCFKILKKKRR